MLKYMKEYKAHKEEVAAQRAAIDKEIEKRQNRIERAEKQITALTDKKYNISASWYEDVVIPLMKDLEKCAGEGWHGEIYGPFGIYAETSIYLRKDEDKSICDQPVYGLTLRSPKEGDMIPYWTGEMSDNYPKGSLGDLNGENKIFAPLPDTVEEIWEIIKKKFEREYNKQ